MMARMLSQLPLPLLPPGAAEIAPGVGLVTGEEGGLVMSSSLNPMLVFPAPPITCRLSLRIPITVSRLPGSSV
jgi:hypothetical protein